MDEADGIIIRTLKSIGCDLEDDIDKLDAGMVVSATARCINLIDPSIEVQQTLPQNMAARYKIGTALADAIKAFGYQDEVGYHTFLYSNVTDVRKVFLFLINKLPKKQLEIQKEFFSPQAILKNLIKGEIIKSQARPWVPSFFLKDVLQRQLFETTKLLLPSGSVECKDEKQHKYNSYHLPILCNQHHIDGHFYSSILENNSLQYALEQNKITSMTNKELQKVIRKSELFESLKTDLNEISKYEKIIKPRNFSSNLNKELSVCINSGKDTPIQDSPCKNVSNLGNEHFKESENEKMKQMTNKIDDLNVNVDDTENEISQFTGLIEQVRNKMEVIREENVSKKETLVNKRKILELTPCAGENLKKLKEMSENYEARLKHQMLQWEEHYNKLSKKFNQLSFQADNSKIESMHLIEEIQDTKMKIKELTTQAGEKEALHTQLVKDYDQLGSGLERSVYTQRIMEIVASIKKQNQEIDKVIVDTKSVQKEINMLSGVVERTFVDADELVFKSVKRDEYARKAYKLLASLHESCDSLIRMVDKTGGMLKDISDLEEQVNQESEVKISENLNKILRDFDEIKQENLVLLQELKAKAY